MMARRVRERLLLGLAHVTLAGWFAAVARFVRYVDIAILRDHGW